MQNKISAVAIQNGDSSLLLDKNDYFFKICFMSLPIK